MTLLIQINSDLNDVITSSYTENVKLTLRIFDPYSYLIARAILETFSEIDLFSRSMHK